MENREAYLITGAQENQSMSGTSSYLSMCRTSITVGSLFFKKKKVNSVLASYTERNLYNNNDIVA